MKITKGPLEGLLILEPKIFLDERGMFYESWRKQDYENLIGESLVQDNVSVSYKNVLRGMHYAQNQGQFIWALYGRVFDVVVDIRPLSKTFGKYFSMELSAETPKQLYMPDGFAHGFCVLSDIAVLNYKETQYYDAQTEGGIVWNDPDINIDWPIKDPILSERDKKRLSFKEFKEINRIERTLNYV